MANSAAASGDDATSDGSIRPTPGFSPVAHGAAFLPGADVDESAVEGHISRLRKRLRPHGIAITVRRGLGYAIGRAA